MGFDGTARVIAHVDFPKVHRVGKYDVDVEAIDGAGDRLDLDPAEVYLVDEIGKMECLSERFVVAMRTLLIGPKPVVATSPSAVVGSSRKQNGQKVPPFGK